MLEHDGLVCKNRKIKVKLVRGIVRNEDYWGGDGIVVTLPAPYDEAPLREVLSHSTVEWDVFEPATGNRFLMGGVSPTPDPDPAKKHCLKENYRLEKSCPSGWYDKDLLWLDGLVTGW
jgi:hypothetical protein